MTEAKFLVHLKELNWQVALRCISQEEYSSQQFFLTLFRLSALASDEESGNELGDFMELLCRAALPDAGDSAIRRWAGDAVDQLLCGRGTAREAAEALKRAKVADQEQKTSVSYGVVCLSHDTTINELCFVEFIPDGEPLPLDGQYPRNAPEKLFHPSRNGQTTASVIVVMLEDGEHIVPLRTGLPMDLGGKTMCTDTLSMTWESTPPERLTVMLQSKHAAKPDEVTFGIGDALGEHSKAGISAPPEEVAKVIRYQITQNLQLLGTLGAAMDYDRVVDIGKMILRASRLLRTNREAEISRAGTRLVDQLQEIPHLARAFFAHRIVELTEGESERATEVRALLEDVYEAARKWSSSAEAAPRRYQQEQESRADEIVRLALDSAKRAHKAGGGLPEEYHDLVQLLGTLTPAAPSAAASMILTMSTRLLADPVAGTMFLFGLMMEFEEFAYAIEEFLTGPLGAFVPVDAKVILKSRLADLKIEGDDGVGALAAALRVSLGPAVLLLEAFLATRLVLTRGEELGISAELKRSIRNLKRVSERGLETATFAAADKLSRQALISATDAVADGKVEIPAPINGVLSELARKGDLWPVGRFRRVDKLLDAVRDALPERDLSAMRQISSDAIKLLGEENWRLIQLDSLKGEDWGAPPPALPKNFLRTTDEYATPLPGFILDDEL